MAELAQQEAEETPSTKGRALSDWLGRDTSTVNQAVCTDREYHHHIHEPADVGSLGCAQVVAPLTARELGQATATKQSAQRLGTQISNAVLRVANSSVTSVRNGRCGVTRL